MKIVIEGIISIILVFTGFPSIYCQTDTQKQSGATESSQIKPPHSYLDNSQYIERMSQYAVYRKKGKIVMLGNSITFRINWSELLNRDDIINRGVGSDITEGFLNRLKYVYSVKPKICYIMGGINDIGYRIPREKTVQNLRQIIDSLKQHRIIPVLQSVLYVAEHHGNSLRTNSMVDSLNLELVKLTGECDITYLDINAVLSANHYLIKEYALKDAVHLTGAGYEKWRDILIADLKNKKIR